MEEDLNIVEEMFKVFFEIVGNEVEWRNEEVEKFVVDVVVKVVEGEVVVIVDVIVVGKEFLEKRKFYRKLVLKLV